MVDYGKCDFLNFCLISMLVLCYFLQSETRFVYHDTAEDQITSRAAYIDTNPESSKLNIKDANDDKNSKDRPSTTEEPNAVVSNIASAVTEEQDLIQKKGALSSSSSPVTERETLETGNAIQLSGDPEYMQYSGQEDTSLEQTQKTMLTSPQENIPQENKVDEESKLGEQFKRYTTMGKTDFPIPNGLETDVDDPNDVITHVKPCDPADESCGTGQHMPKNEKMSDYTYRHVNRLLGPGDLEEGRGRVSPSDSNQTLGDDRYNMDEKRLTELSADVENEDAYF